MGLAEKFNEVMQANLSCHVAWFPIANNFRVGDYGVIHSGIFTRLGHIRQFGVECIEQRSPSTELHFTSANTRIVHFAAGAEVPALPGDGVEARTEIEFSSAGSILVKAGTVAVTEMDNLLFALRELHGRGVWERRFCVVAKLYEAQRALVVATQTAGTKLTLHASAAVLREADRGNVVADLRTEVSAECAARFVGGTGAIGLGLARVGWRQKIQVLGPAQAGPGDDLELFAEATVPKQGDTI